MSKEKIIFKTYGMYSFEELELMEQDAKEFLVECYNEDYPTIEDVDTERATDEVYSQIENNYEDEQINLNKELEGRILAIADIGRWNGRVSGYKILSNNLNSILTGFGCDEFSITYNKSGVKGEGYHHDGRNFVEFREIREDRNIDNLLNKIYNNETISRSTLNYYTKNLTPRIKEVYGA